MDMIFVLVGGNMEGRFIRLRLFYLFQLLGSAVSVCPGSAASGLLLEYYRTRRRRRKGFSTGTPAGGQAAGRKKARTNSAPHSARPRRD